jgi:hypothetical protein
LAGSFFFRGTGTLCCAFVVPVNLSGKKQEKKREVTKDERIFKSLILKDLQSESLPPDHKKTAVTGGCFWRPVRDSNPYYRRERAVS